MPLMSNTVVPISAVPVPLPPAGAANPGAAPTSNVLTAIPNILQDADNWCWAACCEMVFTLQGTNPLPTQCSMAEQQFGQPAGTCCVSPVPTPCDQPAWPDQTYNINGTVFQRLYTTITFDTLQQKIDGGEPVEAYVAWTNGGAHVVLVVGWYTDSGLPEVQVIDPASVIGGRILFSDLQTANGQGAWSQTYLFN